MLEDEADGEGSGSGCLEHIANRWMVVGEGVDLKEVTIVVAKIDGRDLRAAFQEFLEQALCWMVEEAGLSAELRQLDRELGEGGQWTEEGIGPLQDFVADLTHQSLGRQ